MPPTAPITLGSEPSAPIVNLRDLWRFKWRIGAMALLFIAAGAVYISVTPTTFEVSSRVLIREDNPSIDQFNPGVWDREFLATQAEVIRSPLIIREALKDAPITPPATYEKGDMAFVLESLSVTPIIQTDVLKISYRGKDVKEAKELVAALITNFETQVRQDDQGRHAEELALLTRREAELREQLEQLQDERTEFRRNSPLIGQSRETLLVQSNQLAQMAQRLSEARTRRMELENKLETHAVAKAERERGKEFNPVIPVSRITPAASPRNRPDTSIGAVDNDPSTNVLRDVSNAAGSDFTEIQLQLWQARVLYKNLSNKYTGDHPEMAGAEQQVQYWEDLLAQRIQAAELGLSQELASARTTEVSLQNLYNEEQARVKKLDDYLVAEEALVVKFARVEETHAVALARLKEYQLTSEALESGRSSAIIQVLDGPELQEAVVWPQPKILLGLCGVLGLIAGVVSVSLRKP